MRRSSIIFLLALLASVVGPSASPAITSKLSLIYNPGTMKPTDSTLNVAVGDKAPDFTLPAIDGGSVQLSSYFGKSNIVLSFVPAAWTPVCSDQWPGYNLAKQFFTDYNAVLLGITVDNIPTLHAWVQEMGHLWFPVLSDFWPHGKVAAVYGVLRGDGMTERALVFIDKQGIIRAVEVNDINVRPALEQIVDHLKELP